MSAFTTPSGGYTLVGRRTPNDRTSHPATPPPYWQSASGIRVGALLLGGASTLPVVLYLLVPLPEPARVMLAVILVVLLGGAVTAWVVAWGIGALERQQKVNATQEVARWHELRDLVSHAGASRQQQMEDLADLPRRVRLLVEQQEAQQAEILSGIQGELGQLREAVGDRLAELERTVDQATQAEEIMRRSRSGAEVVPFGPRGA